LAFTTAQILDFGARRRAKARLCLRAESLIVARMGRGIYFAG
jgi:hypothetical protein